MGISSPRWSDFGVLNKFTYNFLMLVPQLFFERVFGTLGVTALLEKSDIALVKTLNDIWTRNKNNEYCVCEYLSIEK